MILPCILCLQGCWVTKMQNTFFLPSQWNNKRLDRNNYTSIVRSVVVVKIYGVYKQALKTTISEVSLNAQVSKNRKALIKESSIWVIMYVIIHEFRLQRSHSHCVILLHNILLLEDLTISKTSNRSYCRFI